MIALLRGVNVGGNNPIAMPALRSAFENSGFQSVRTYINSGNVLFESGCEDEETIRRSCEAAIAAAFGLPVAVAVISAQALSEALDHAPGWWGADPDAKHNAIFVIPPATAESVAKEVGAIKPEYESVASHGSVIFWSAPIKTFSRTRWSKIAGTPAYGHVTIRNANTAKKLRELAR